MNLCLTWRIISTNGTIKYWHWMIAHFGLLNKHVVVCMLKLIIFDCTQMAGYVNMILLFDATVSC